MPDGSRTVDSALIAFLVKKKLEVFQSLLEAEEITSLETFREIIADDEAKQALVKAFLGEKSTMGRKHDAKRFQELTPEEVDTEKDEPQDVVPKANDELKSYLVEKGFPVEYLPLFEKHGVASLQALQRLCENSAEKDNLIKELKDGGTIGKHRYPPSSLMAEQLATLSANDVGRKVKDKQIAREHGSKEFQDKKAKLEEAIKKVEAFRQECATDAKTNMDAIQKRAMDELKEVLQAADSEKVLEKLGTDVADKKSLEAALKGVSLALSEKVASELSASISKVEPLETQALAEANDLFRGVLLTAAGVREVTGSNLVKMDCKLSPPPTYVDDYVQFSSQELFDYAKKTVEQSSSAFSTANKAQGAAFVGSGVLALSIAGSYAKAKQEYTATAEAQRTSRACRLMTHKIWAPKISATLPRDQMELSDVACKAISAMVRTPEPVERERIAFDLLDNFGSHLFKRVTLGGCFEHVATATATTREKLATMDHALSTASQWAVSAAGSYVGLGGIASVGSANEGRGGKANADSTTDKASMSTEEVAVKIITKGGMASLPVDLWKQSLSKNPYWTVIDRDDAIAVWEILRYAQAKNLTEEEREEARAILERVWVQKYFVPSLEGIDPSLARNEAFSKAKSTAELEEALARLTSPPVMNLACFREEFDAEQHFRKTLKLPKGYKILSGGASSFKQKEGNFLVSSYPSYNATEQCWSWHAEMKDVDSVSAERHEIAVIALYDPDDKWDVQIFENKSSRDEPCHTLVAGNDSGYLITGGGGKIDTFLTAVLTACGFVPDASSSGTPAVAPGFSVSSRSCLHESKHGLVAIAIGILPKDGTRLEPEYLHQVSKSNGHHDHQLVHTPRGAAGNPGSGMIGGGAWLRPGVDNFLTGSCPVVDATLTAFAWKASSKDHVVAAHTEMAIVTLGLSNVEAAVVTRPAQKADVI